MLAVAQSIDGNGHVANGVGSTGQHSCSSVVDSAVVARQSVGSVISVDTFHAEVAKAAVENGADIVNDVSGGTLDAGMLSMVRKCNNY